MTLNSENQRRTLLHALNLSAQVEVEREGASPQAAQNVTVYAHARQAVSAASVTDPALVTVPLDALTLPALRDAARQRGIAVPGKAKRADVLDLLTHQTS